MTSIQLTKAEITGKQISEQLSSSVKANMYRQTSSPKRLPRSDRSSKITGWAECFLEWIGKQLRIGTAEARREDLSLLIIVDIDKKLLTSAAYV